MNKHLVSRHSALLRTAQAFTTQHLHLHRSTSLIATAAPAPSYWHEPGSRPMLHKTLGQVLEESARKYADQTALISVEEDVRLSFQDLLTESDRAAAGLLDLGLEPGERVAIWAPNCWQWVVCRLAAARAGLIAVDMNPLYREQDALHCLRQARVAAVVAAREHRGVLYHETLTAIAPEILRASGSAIGARSLPDLRHFISLSEKPVPGALLLNELTASASKEQIEAVQSLQNEISPDNGCNIQFSSGTTGDSKAILLTHNSVVNAGYMFGFRLNVTDKEKVCLLLPLFHVAGSVCTMTMNLHHGATLVIPSEKYDPRRSARTIASERCNLLVGTPTVYVDLMKVFLEEGIKTDSLHTAVSGGAPITTDIVRRMIDVLGLKRMCAVFGLSETCAIAFQGLPGDSFEQMAGTVGKVAEHMQVKVVDEKGHMVPFGTAGELYVRGYPLMAEYYQNEKATKETLANGWLKTGDKVILQEDGYARVVGRLKDVIIRGGENIYPAEIENILVSHPDIIEAQVVGVPDERLGEESCACLRLRDDAVRLSARDVRDVCAAARIAGYKIPRYSTALRAYPVTPSGKVQKHRLRELCAGLLREGRLDDSRYSDPVPIPEMRIF